jgi:hypothetical protein
MSDVTVCSVTVRREFSLNLIGGMLSERLSRVILYESGQMEGVDRDGNG